MPLQPPRSFTLRRLRLSDIKQRFTRNLGLRLLAVAIAIGLWVFVNAGQHEAQTLLVVPVQYTGLAPDLMIVNDHPQFVNVQVSGPRTLLSLLDAGRMTVHLDLRGVTAGEADFKITPEMFNIPRQTTIESVSPAQITLDIDQVVTKELPVRLDTTGQVSTGLEIGSVELKPSVVAATGPRRLLRNMSSVDTLPLDVQGEKADLSREVQLADTGNLIKLSTGRVLATVHVQNVIIEREFHDIPITVRNAGHRFTVVPHTASVEIRGPQLALQTLKLDGSVYVDAQDLTSGWHQEPLMVELPTGMELVRQEPEKVKLRLYKN